VQPGRPRGLPEDWPAQNARPPWYRLDYIDLIVRSRSIADQAYSAILFEVELKGLDPPPTWPLGEALLGSRDTGFRLRIIKVLVALAAVDKVRVLCVLCEAFKQRRDPEVKRAVATALLVLVTERLGQGPSPAEDLARDLDLES
jgi:hypothetical protein